MSRKESAGAYGITSKGIDTSAPSLGVALSKAQTLAVQIQRELPPDEDAVQSLYIRKLGQDTIARVDVMHGAILTFVDRR